MSGRQFRNVVGPTPVGALTCWLVVLPELPPLLGVDFVGYYPNLYGGYRFRILAQPREVENFLQGETWPFLYHMQGMCPSDAITVKPGSHPSRYLDPRYHKTRIQSTRTRHLYFIGNEINNITNKRYIYMFKTLNHL